MVWERDGWRPSKPNLELQLERIRKEVPGLPSFDIEHTERLLDSSQMRPSDWNTIGTTVRDRLAKYRGIVVLHGTDSMAYSASALAFMLNGLGKPVVFTGAQRPLVVEGSDGRDNFVSALRLAASGTPAEVTICFARKILRGCRSTKVSASRDAAFDSPNIAPLLTWAEGEDITPHLPLTSAVSAQAELTLHQVKEPLVLALRFFPGISEALLRNLIAQPKPRGIVFELFGSGNGPTHQSFLDVLVAAHQAEIAIVAVSQCLHGAIEWVYAAGTPYPQHHVLSGRDMTTEAAVTKLTVLASRHSYADLRKQMELNLRGEMTIKSKADNPDAIFIPGG
jgi:L-asparaginase type I